MKTCMTLLLSALTLTACLPVEPGTDGGAAPGDGGVVGDGGGPANDGAVPNDGGTPGTDGGGPGTDGGSPGDASVDPSCETAGLSAELEPNDDRFTATRLASGASATGAIASAGDIDMFEVLPCGERILQVELTNDPVISTPVDLEFEIVNEDGRELDSMTDFDGSDGITRLTTNVYLSGSAKYLIRVKDRGSDDRDEASYTITATLLTVPDADQEPNGNDTNPDIRKRIATPVEAGIPKSAFIASKYDQDIFAITVDKESMIEVTVSNEGIVSTPVDLEFTILNEDAETELISETDFDGSDGTTRLRTSRYLPAAGTYYVMVADRGRDDYDYAQAYDITIDVFDDPDEAVEPNGNVSNPDERARIATPLADGQEFIGFIATERDRDVYSIAVPDEMLLEVEIDSGNVVSTPVDLEFEIMDTDADREMGSETDFDGSNGITYLRQVRYLPAGGTYFIRVADRGRDDYDYMQGYGVRASLIAVPDGDAEPNGNTSNPNLLADIATPITSGVARDGYIASEGDYDCYSIRATGTGTLLANLNNAPIVSTIVDYEIWIVAAGQTSELDRDTDFDGSDGTTRIGVSANVSAGDYLVCVRDRGNDNYDLQPYSLTVTAP